MNKLKRLISIALALVMIASLAACGGTTPASQSPKASDPAAPAPASSEAPQAEEKIKIKFLSLSADDNRNNIREKYIKVNAPKEFPNVEIEYDLGGGGQDYANKLKAYNASGDMPDVWFSEQNLSSVVVKAGNALDLLPYVKETGFDKLFSMPEMVAPDKDGKLYCVQPGADQYFTPRLYSRIFLQLIIFKLFL